MASTHLSRTQTSGNRQIFTQSFWCKIADPAGTQTLAGTFDDSSNYNYCYLDSGALNLQWKQSGSVTAQLNTTRLLRDPSAFYNIVYSVDTTQATAENRIKLYINGSQVTSFSTSTYPTQNRYTEVNANGITHRIGSVDGSSQYFNGLMTYVAHVDNTAYDASYFGETDSVSGIWKPKTSPSVTWGTNGFLLKFENSGAMGTDSSGNSNTFTVSGTLTQNVDTPSNNFTNVNALIPTVIENCTMTNGNNTINSTSGLHRNAPTTFAIPTGSGKYYWEMRPDTITTHIKIGIIYDEWDKMNLFSQGAEFSGSSLGYSYRNDGKKENNDSSSTYGDSYTVNDIIGVAFDSDNRKLYFSKNGVWQNSGNPESGATGTGSVYTISDGYTYFPCVNLYEAKVSFNFGGGYFGTTAVASAGTAPSEGGIFEYNCPNSYQALCTKGINSF